MLDTSLLILILLVCLANLVATVSPNWAQPEAMTPAEENYTNLLSPLDEMVDEAERQGLYELPEYLLPVDNHRWVPFTQAGYGQVRDSVMVDMLIGERCCNYLNTRVGSLLCADCGHQETCIVSNEPCAVE